MRQKQSDNQNSIWRQNLPSFRELKKTLGYLNRQESIAFLSLVAISIVSLVVLLWNINNRFLLSVPEKGGTLIEGVIGAPTLINPLLASSDVDRDLTSLVYSGLLRIDEKGNLIPDLAEKFEISEDGLTYKFTLKENLSWHDGAPLTTEDVAFTIKQAKNPAIKSVRRANWEGVRVETVDEKNIEFHLNQPYSLFLENTTLGILPAHLWKTTAPELFSFSKYNIEAVGSGPYKIDRIKKRTGGDIVIAEYYELIPFAKFALEPAKINLKIKFYQNNDDLLAAFKNKEVESISLSSPMKTKEIDDLSQIKTTTSQVIFAVFYNQDNSPILMEQRVRQALDMAIDKDEIIATVLNGYGEKINGPIPPGSIGSEKPTTDDENIDQKIEKAISILEKGGWKRNAETGIMEKKVKEGTRRLEFKIKTANNPDLIASSEVIKNQWQKIGANVDIEIFEIVDFNQNVIRPRKYDVLFFGEIIGRDPDLFSFWHSSQRNDPGLNIALYANSKTDPLLEKARRTRNEEEKIRILKEISEELSADIPASFIFTPYFLYATPEKVKGVLLPPITTPSERFSSVYKWFIATDKVWKIFVN